MNLWNTRIAIAMTNTTGMNMLLSGTLSSLTRIRMRTYR